MQFPETNWTVLALATMNGGQDEAKALNALCQQYWKPVSAFIASRGAPSARIDDLTQDFFLQLMNKGFFRKASRDKGTFRSFMLGSLRYFLADDARRNSTQKKGGHLERAPLFEDSASIEAPDEEFDTAWAELIFDKVYERVREETTQMRSQATWELLETFLPGAAEPVGYATLAAHLGVSEGGAKSEVFRLRKRMKETLRAEVGQTVSAPHEIDDELAHLRAALEKGAKPL